MKKSLLTIFSAVLSLSAFAQPSPSWSTLQNTNFPHTSAGLILMDVVDANVVWGLGNYGTNGRQSNLFTMTSNAGSTWVCDSILPDTNVYQISNIEGIDAMTCWMSAWTKATGNKGVVYNTTNGGVSWQNVTPANSFTNNASFANFVCFVNPTVGIVQGDPVGGEYEIWKTINGGTSWSKIAGANIPNPVGGEYGLTDSYFALGNTIWFGTNNGKVYKSMDAGDTWTVSTAMAGVTEVSRIAFVDANNGLCSGTSGTTANLWRTTNGGATWTNLGVPTGVGFNDIAPITGTSWFASVSNPNTNMSYSMDNGTTWIDWGSIGIGYLQIGFANNNVGWAGTFSDNLTAGFGGVYMYSGIPLGIANAPQAPKAINAYPNPSTGVVNILMPVAKRGLNISVTDALGKVVYTETTITTGSETKALNLKHLDKGIYFIDLTTENQKYHQKIVIE